MIKVVSKVMLEDTPAGFVIRHCVFICDRAMGRECDPVWQSAHIFDHQLQNGLQKNLKNYDFFSCILKRSRAGKLVQY